MHDNARGGDDILTGGVSSFTINVIHGDAGAMDGDSRGGNDTLIGGAMVQLLMATPGSCATTPAAAMTR